MRRRGIMIGGNLTILIGSDQPLALKCCGTFIRIGGRKKGIYFGANWQSGVQPGSVRYEVTGR